MPHRAPTHRPHGEPDRRGSDREYDRRRIIDSRLAYAKSVRSSQRWRDLRAVKLMRQPLCEECLRHGVTRAAQEVHHRIPIRVNPHLAYVMDNLVSVCAPCHRLLDARENRKRK